MSRNLRVRLDRLEKVNSLKKVNSSSAAGVPFPHNFLLLAARVSCGTATDQERELAQPAIEFMQECVRSAQSRPDPLDEAIRLLVSRKASADTPARHVDGGTS